MAIGRGAGDNRMLDAANMAISSPLLELSIDGAKGVLFNVSGGEDLGIQEINEAADLISRAADPDANIIFGASIDPHMGDEVKITLIATGFDQGPRVNQRNRLYPSTLSNPMSSGQGYGQPSYQRQQPGQQQPGQRQGSQQPPQQPQPSYNESADDLDIPPFLRNRRR
jgi:cell division protein FtsZ